jgi:hypothetical protein
VGNIVLASRLAKAVLKQSEHRGPWKGEVLEALRCILPKRRKAIWKIIPLKLTKKKEYIHRTPNANSQCHAVARMPKTITPISATVHFALPLNNNCSVTMHRRVSKPPASFNRKVKPPRDRNR